MGSISPCHSAVMSRVIPDCPGDVLHQPLVQGVQSVHVTEKLLYDLLCEGLVVASPLPHLWQQGLQAQSSQQSPCAQTDIQTYAQSDAVYNSM